jgi:hypothetical protein
MGRLFLLHPQGPKIQAIIRDRVRHLQAALAV